MGIKGRITDRAWTAAVLLTGVIPFVVQPGPVAGEAVAERHVDRLLDERPEGEGELPDEVELQCHLIPLVSDAVTLRGLEISEEAVAVPVPEQTVPSAGPVQDEIDPGSPVGRSEFQCGASNIQPRVSRSPQQPRGP